MGVLQYILTLVIIASHVNSSASNIPARRIARQVAHARGGLHSARVIPRRSSWRRFVPRTYPYRSIYGHLIFPPIPVAGFSRERRPVPVRIPSIQPRILQTQLQGDVPIRTTPMPILRENNVNLLSTKTPESKSTLEAQVGTSSSGDLLNILQNIDMNNGRGILQTNEVNSVDIFEANKELQRLFESASKRLRSKEDEEKLKQHLLMLANIQKHSLEESFKTLEKQLKYIETIKEQVIRREVLKIFVKDIVEKSGVMNSGVDVNADIGTVGNLLSIIDKITDKLSAGASTIRSVGTTTVAPVMEPGKQPEVAERIANALSLLSRDPTTVKLDSIKAMSIETASRLTGFRGRQRPETSSAVGLSIFGERVKPSVDLPEIRTTTESFNIETIEREIAGGNGAYWTHLQSGLAELICAMCQQQQRQSCIRRYCSDVSSNATTMAPR